MLPELRGRLVPRGQAPIPSLPDVQEEEALTLPRWPTRIRRLLAVLACTPGDLAEVLEVRPATVTRWLRSSTRPAKRTWGLIELFERYLAQSVQEAREIARPCGREIASKDVVVVSPVPDGSRTFRH